MLVCTAFLKKCFLLSQEFFKNAFFSPKPTCGFFSHAALPKDFQPVTHCNFTEAVCGSWNRLATTSSPVNFQVQKCMGGLQRGSGCMEWPFRRYKHHTQDPCMQLLFSGALCGIAAGIQVARDSPGRHDAPFGNHGIFERSRIQVGDI